MVEERTIYDDKLDMGTEVVLEQIYSYIIRPITFLGYAKP